MPSSRSRSASTRRRRSSAAKKLQKRVRGKQTRKRHAKSIEQIYRNLEKTNECALCHEPMTKKEAITKLGCTHRFHTECLDHSLRSGHANCPLCRTVIPNNPYTHLAPPNMTYEEALVSRRQALEERQIATEALSNAVLRRTNYEQSNRIRRRERANSPTYINLLRNQEIANEELRRARERVTNYMNIIDRLS